MSILSTLVDVGTSLLQSKSNNKAIKQVQGLATSTRDANNALAQNAYNDAQAGLQPWQVRGNDAANSLYAGIQAGSGPDVAARDTYTRPAYGDAPTYARPTFDRPGSEAFKFGVNDYVKTPGFDFQQQRGMDALKSDKTLGGLLRSGKAVKGALDFSQGLAMQDFTGERDFAYNQFATDRARQDANFAADRSYGSGAFEADRGYGTDLYLNNRNFGNANFESDRSYGTGVYDADRAYATGRYDTRNNLLAGFADQGYNATGAGINAGQGYASTTAGNNSAYAATMADGYLGKAANKNALYAQIPKAYAGVESSFAQAMGVPTGGAPTGGGSSYSFLRRY